MTLGHAALLATARAISVGPTPVQHLVTQERGDLETVVVDRQDNQPGFELTAGDCGGDLGRVLPDEPYADLRVPLVKFLGEIRQQEEPGVAHPPKRPPPPAQ